MVTRDCVLIGVEGNHDQAFIAKILKNIFQLTECQYQKHLDSIWRKFIPTYPTQSGKLHLRLDMPSILYNEVLSIAIYAGEGSNLVENLQLKLSDIDYSNSLKAFGIVADADSNTPSSVVQRYRDGLKDLFPGFPSETSCIGAIVDEKPRLGIFILPDNSSNGVLDTMLCKCGDVAYPTLMPRAKEYISKFSDDEVGQIGWKPFDRQKAIVAAVASILKPGGTNTATLSNNDWVSQDTYNQIEEIKAFCTFLENLLELKLDKVGLGTDQGGQPISI
jgi:hypothetical protein